MPILTCSWGPKVHLNKEQLAWRINQLTSLLRLYASQTQWLSCGSRLYFGQLHRGAKVAVLFDWSDQTCFSDWYDQYLAGMELLLEEQLPTRDAVHLIPLGSKVNQPKVLNAKNKL